MKQENTVHLLRTRSSICGIFYSKRRNNIVKRTPFTPLYYEYKLSTQFTGISTRAIYNIAVVITHQMAMSKKKLTQPARQDPKFKDYNLKQLTAYTLFKSKRINIDFTDEIYLKLQDIKKQYHFKTEAEAISYSLRTLYLQYNGGGITITEINQLWEVYREKSQRPCSENIKIELRLPIDIVNSYRIRALEQSKATGRDITYKTLMINVLNDFIEREEA